MTVTLLIGTVKGAFLARADDSRRSFRLDGPWFKGWKVTAAARDGSGRALLATASDVYGPALHASADLERWSQTPGVPREPDGGELKQVWRLHARGGDEWLAGIDEAALLRTTDGGATWTPFEGLNHHRTRAGWFPGAGGLCAHAILADSRGGDPGDAERLFCGISAVGVFRSDDGGLSWEPKNQGVPCVIEDRTHKDIGYCVHALVRDPDDPATIWRQDHRGVFRTRDAGDTWTRIEEGLPSGFGFPIALDRRTKALFTVPLESDEYRIPPGGRLAVYRSDDGGDTWQEKGDGLPREHAYAGVLRHALAVDHLDPCGVYLGTTSGQVFASDDAGESWRRVADSLPRVLFVEVLEGGG